MENWKSIKIKTQTKQTENLKCISALSQKEKSIQSVIETIQNSENIGNKKYTRYTKRRLISKIKSFSIDDFSCFADDGNTCLDPDVYYSKITKKKMKEELDSIDCQMSFHTVNCNSHKYNMPKPDYGINLLRCCNECTDIFLKNLFKQNYIMEILRK